MTNYIGKTQSDEYDWLSMFKRFRETPNNPHVRRVFRILELLKSPKSKPAELLTLLKPYRWRSLIAPGGDEVLRPPMDFDNSADGPPWEYRSVRWLLDLLRQHG